MPKGPILNSLSRSFTTRDSLGIESVANSMSAEICPVVNTVTPRAYYWPFMVWIYYDFYRYSGIEDWTVAAFDKYLKRQDYFFVLAVLLTPDSDQTNLVGKQQSQIDLDTDTSGPYPFNEKYFKTRYGGMQYYNAGCISMGFIIDHDPETSKSFTLPRLTKEGECMALAFEEVIRNTVYYKEYRRNDKPVPRKVLKEYGAVINISLCGFDKCKDLLRRAMLHIRPRSALRTAPLPHGLPSRHHVLFCSMHWLLHFGLMWLPFRSSFSHDPPKILQSCASHALLLIPALALPFPAGPGHPSSCSKQHPFRA